MKRGEGRTKSAISRYVFHVIIIAHATVAQLP